MSQRAVEIFLGKVITDANFKAKACSSLESACWDNGLLLSSAEISYLKKIDFALLTRVSDAIDDAIKCA